MIAATNRIDLVDPSVLRPGRLGMHLYVPLPGLDDRRAILAQEARGLAFAPGAEQLLADLAQRTDGWSGADLHALGVAARMSALARGGYATMPPLVEADFAGALRQREAPPAAARPRAVA